MLIMPFLQRVEAHHQSDDRRVDYEGFAFGVSRKGLGNWLRIEVKWFKREMVYVGSKYVPVKDETCA
jgi:hypothetical protein